MPQKPLLGQFFTSPINLKTPHAPMMLLKYLFGENILQREAQRGSKGTDKPPYVERQLSDGGQQDAANDGDEGQVHLQGREGGRVDVDAPEQSPRRPLLPRRRDATCPFGQQCELGQRGSGAGRGGGRWSSENLRVGSVTVPSLTPYTISPVRSPCSGLQTGVGPNICPAAATNTTKV